MKCKCGVLLINTGTPANPNAASVRAFLAEFLLDQAIVDLPGWLWQPILKTFILPMRAPKSAGKYKAIWGNGGSPLLLGTEKLAHAIEQELQKLHFLEICVETAMRYGSLSIEKQLTKLQKKGVSRVVALPLFPQTSLTTTGTIFKEIGRLNSTVPIKKLNGYGSHPEYIRAMAEHLQNYWQSQPRAKQLIFSFHGIPQKLVAQGDTYERECRQSIELLVEQLQLPRDSFKVGFQSRFGPGKWLEPETIELVKKAAQDGVETLQIFAPGFAIDCLETLHEINIEMRKLYQQFGGKNFEYIPALNSSTDHIRALTNILMEYAI